MITAAQLVPLRSVIDDDQETEQLKASLARFRRGESPRCLTATEFEDILRWKLRSQIGRQRQIRAANTNETIGAVTGLALTINHPDKDYELELRIGILCVLRGVSVPVASAVLALTFPEEYAVIDFRVWRQVFGKERTTFSVGDYKRYMSALRPLAAELGWSVQAVDLAIWEFDRKQ